MGQDREERYLSPCPSNLHQGPRPTATRAQIQTGSNTASQPPNGAGASLRLFRALRDRSTSRPSQTLGSIGPGWGVFRALLGCVRARAMRGQADFTRPTAWPGHAISRKNLRSAPCAPRSPQLPATHGVLQPGGGHFPSGVCVITDRRVTQKRHRGLCGSPRHARSDRFHISLSMLHGGPRYARQGHLAGIQFRQMKSRQIDGAPSGGMLDTRADLRRVPTPPPVSGGAR